MLLFIVSVFSSAFSSFPYLNTSYVIVYRESAAGLSLRYWYLNTSYVIVYLFKQTSLNGILHNLNTSYVIVCPSSDTHSDYTHKFKYILCYCLSSFLMPPFQLCKNLNTSYVIVYLYTTANWHEFLINLNTSYVIVYRLQ